MKDVFHFGLFGIHYYKKKEKKKKKKKEMERKDGRWGKSQVFVVMG